jgi:hypothetical protein
MYSHDPSMTSTRRVLLLSAASIAASFNIVQAEPTARIVGTATGAVAYVPSVAATDGYLYGITEASAKTQGGSLFRIAPGGTSQILHRFPQIASTPKKNTGGYRPVGKPVLGLDGFLYGLTFQGGAFAQGVLYRVRPDGKEYATVADLDGRLLPEGSFQVQPVGAQSLLIQDAAGQFYFTTTRGGLVRVEPNGQLTLLYQNSLAFKILPEADPSVPPSSGRPPQIDVVSQVNGAVKVDEVRVTDGTVLFSYSSPEGVFPNTFAIPLQAVKAGLVLSSGVSDGTDVTGRFSLLGRDGSLKVVGSTLKSQFNGITLEGRFLHAEDDGTTYFAAGTPTSATGNTILKLSPNGSQTIVAGFPSGIASPLVGGPSSSYYSATTSPTIYIPHDGQTFWSPAWMDSGNAAKYDIIKSPRKGVAFYQISPGGGALYSDPLAQIDVVSSRGRDSLSIPVLANDKAAAGSQIRLTGADSDDGTATVSGSTVSFTSTLGGDFSSQLTYSIDNGPDASGQATGTALIRGDIAGTYTDADLLVRKQPLAIRVSATGRFTATVPDGNGKFVPVSGLLDYRDRGLAIAIPKTGSTIRLLVFLNSEDSQPVLSYVLLDATGARITGAAKLK